MVAADVLHETGGSADDLTTFGLDLGIATGLGDETLRIGPLKIFSDGSMLGRTAAGVWLTHWLPTEGILAALRLESLADTAMYVFNLAGMRAIMIGIALGVVATSLKILLGVDRSYLGSD